MGVSKPVVEALLVVLEILRFAQNDITFYFYYPHDDISLKENCRWGGGKYFTR
jgi:hypothetical protein